MVDTLHQVVYKQQDDGHPREAHHVGRHDEGQIEAGILDLGGHVLLLHLLEVELGEDVEPVGDLDNEEKFEHEGHGVVRVALPEGREGEEVLAVDDVPGPDEGDQVEAEQLAGLVELHVLHFGQVELLVDFVQHILLDDGVHHHGNEQVEEHGGHVLDAGAVEGEVGEGGGLGRQGHVVMESDEDGGQRAGHLEHEAQHEDHGHTGDNVRMVLDHKLVAETKR